MKAFDDADLSAKLENASHLKLNDELPLIKTEKLSPEKEDTSDRKKDILAFVYNELNAQDEDIETLKIIEQIGTKLPLK
ncbi:MAG: hypothetical protein WCH34_09140 [Bacteroidota bacterium]